MVKQRLSKLYRHPLLDQQITSRRVNSECKILQRAIKAGVNVPKVFHVNKELGLIYMQYLNGTTVKAYLDAATDKLSDCKSLRKETSIFLSQYKEPIISTFTDRELAEQMGKQIALLHDYQIIHGDLTTSNFMVKLKYDTINVESEQCFHLDQINIIDFGLSKVTNNMEDKAIDLFVLEKSLQSTHSNSENFVRYLLD